MATMKDIAREAGVSYGTVSNVMNKTGKVSVEKIRLVEEAAERIGYRPHAQAQRLREGASHIIALVLPELQPMYCALYNSLVKCLKVYNYEVSLTLTEDVEEIEREEIIPILSSRPDAVIALSCLEHPEEAYDCDNLILLNRTISGQPGGAVLSGFDYAAAAADIADYCLRRNLIKAALFSPPLRYDNEKCFIDGLRQSGLEITGFSADEKLILQKTLEFFAAEDDYDVLITLDSGRAETLLGSAAYLGKKIGRIISVSENTVMPKPGYIQYVMDYQKLGQVLTEHIMAVLRKEAQPGDLWLPNGGFIFQSKSPAVKIKNAKLKLLTIESPTTHAVNGLLGGFAQESGIKVQITALGFDELYHVLHSGNEWQDFDMVRMDMAWLPDMGRRIYRPFRPTEVFNGAAGDFLDGVYSEYGRMGDEVYALPFDPSAQLLFYRRDLFENARIKRQYYEMYHEELLPPVTYQQFGRIAGFFTQAINPESPVTYGTVMTYGSASVAAADFLPYLLGDHKSLETITPQHLETSLELYLAARQFTDRHSYRWWSNSVEQFARGEAAMITVFNNYATEMVNSKSSRIMGKIGCSRIPGERPLIGGGVIGITGMSRNEAFCHCFINWLYTEATAKAITLCGGLTPQKSIYQDFDVLSLFPWMEICKTSFVKGTRQYFGSQFDSQYFEHALGVQIKQVCEGTIDQGQAAGMIYRMIKEMKQNIE